MGPSPCWNPNYFLLGCEGQVRVKTTGQPEASGSQDLPPEVEAVDSTRNPRAKQSQTWMLRSEYRAIKLSLGPKPGMALLSETVTQA